MQDTGILALVPLTQKKAIIEYIDEKIADGIAANTTAIANLNAWATAFATKLNADAVDNNAKAAFPLTLDTNYDTNPQA